MFTEVKAMAKITKEDLLHIADQARLNLTEEELTHYENEINDVLTYTVKLHEVNTNDVKATTNGIELTKILREDIPVKWDKREAALDNAPEHEDGHFKVPAIMD
jgi:aspartyl-tRNA(Asn)/glutamyl-tRNA(Gln) amidotransferase subunit C